MARSPLPVRLDLLPRADLDPDAVAVVVDVLRMTTTATVLAELGLARLLVVADPDDARRRARRENALLLGERNARPLPGFDGGNSPLEFTGTQVLGRTAVLCTTNGSAAVEACAGAASTLLGSLRNASAVARRARQLAGGEVRVVCAGTAGRVSLDDVVAAGRIVDALLRLEPDARLDDGARLAHLAASTAEPGALLGRARHARALAAAGFADDVAEAARTDITRQVMERLPGHADAFAPHRVGEAAG